MANRLEPIREEDLTCGICSKLYKQPMLCECGHTFCKSCIERRCEKIESSCPICRYLVLPLTPNVNVQMDIDDWVRPFSRHQAILNYDFLSTPQTSKRVGRRGSRQANNDPSAANFSVPREIAPLLSLRHRREMELLAHSNTSSEEYEAVIQRDIPRRRSERTRRPMEAAEYQVSPATHPFARFSNFRGTVAGERGLTRLAVASTTNSTRDYPLLLELSSQKNDKQSKSKLKSMWQRMPFLKPKKADPTPYVCPRLTTDIIRTWGRYRGMGANFSRLNKGPEVLVGVFGSQSSGKTTFVDNFTLRTTGSNQHKVLSNAERMDWCEPLATNNPPFAHMTTTTYMMSDGIRIVDLVEAECDSRVVNGMMTEATSKAFVDTVDAAILLFFASDESSFAKIMSYHRRLAQRNVPCIVVANCNSNVERRISDTMVRNVFARMNVSRCETNLFEINGDTVEIVQHLVERVPPPELPPLVLGSIRRWENGRPV